MARKPMPAPARPVDEDPAAPRFARVVAAIVGLENYRKPKNGDALPSVAYAHADAEALSDALQEIFKGLPASDVDIELMTDADASLVAVHDHLACTIRNLSADDLFIFYYAGHGVTAPAETASVCTTPIVSTSPIRRSRCAMCCWSRWPRARASRR